jgi:hypothetical protein
MGKFFFVVCLGVLLTGDIKQGDQGGLIHGSIGFGISYLIAWALVLHSWVGSVNGEEKRDGTGV